MTRYCDGSDEFLVMHVIKKPDARGVVREVKVPKPDVGSEEKPCTCGTLFDDAKRSVIWPHPMV